MNIFDVGSNGIRLYLIDSGSLLQSLGLQGKSWQLLRKMGAKRIFPSHGISL